MKSAPEDQTQDDRDGPRYLPRDQVKPGALRNSLGNLELFADDMFLTVQASRIDMVDQFIMGLEAKVLEQFFEDDRTPEQAHFLAAQSEMWIFALYEVLRTWTQRARDFVRLSENGGFPNKLASLKAADSGYLHHGREMRMRQIEKAMQDPSLVGRLRSQLLLLHQPFTLLEFVRVSIAKHEVSGKAKGIALSPGYGRVNFWSGSLDYELENGKHTFHVMSRRDIADSFRYLDPAASPPSPRDLEDFDAWVRGDGSDRSESPASAIGPAVPALPAGPQSTRG